MELEPAREPRRPSLIRRGLRALFRLTTLGIILGFAACVALGGGPQLPSVPQASGTPTTTQTPNTPHRLLPVVTAKRNKNYAWLSGTDGIRWDPCRAIRYVVNPANQPAGGLKAIKQGIAVVSRATGLLFEYAGSTSERYAGDRAAYQPGTYPDSPDEWAPVLIAWEKDRRFNSLVEATGEGSGDVAQVVGFGGPEWVTTSVVGASRGFMVTGEVVFRASELRRMLRAGKTTRVRAVVIHELSHVMGLDHVSNRGQIMYERIGVTNLGKGDRYGLSLAGDGPCAAQGQWPTPN